MYPLNGFVLEMKMLRANSLNYNYLIIKHPVIAA